VHQREALLVSASVELFAAAGCSGGRSAARLNISQFHLPQPGARRCITRLSFFNHLEAETPARRPSIAETICLASILFWYMTRVAQAFMFPSSNSPVAVKLREIDQFFIPH
jgi:hypothetical protein